MLSISIFKRNSKQNQVQRLLYSYVSLIILSFTACINESDLAVKPKTVDQYVLELETDPSYLNLIEGMRRIANEAHLSGVEVFEFTAEDLKRLQSAKGTNKEQLIQTFTGSPKFLMDSEVTLLPLLTDFLHAHADLAHEELQVVQGVFMKLQANEIEDFLKQARTSLKYSYKIRLYVFRNQKQH